MIESVGQKKKKFYVWQIAGKHNFKCKLRYLETPKQAHFRMKKCFWNKKHLIQTIKITFQNDRI